MIQSGDEFKEIVFSEMARMSRALSDPLRLKILELIVQIPRSVEQVAELLDLPHATASHHLRILQEAGFAGSVKSGRMVYYESTGSGEEMWACLLASSQKNSPAIRSAVREFFNEDRCLKLGYPELKKIIKSEKIILIDVRPESEYEGGHFPGAVSIPLNELKDRLNEISKECDVVAYCRGKYCVLSHKAAELLSARGYKSYRLSGGIAEWKGAGQILQKGK